MNTADMESPTDAPESLSDRNLASLRGYRHLLASAISEHRVSWHGGKRGCDESARRLAESDQMRQLVVEIREQVARETGGRK